MALGILSWFQHFPPRLSPSNAPSAQFRRAEAQAGQKLQGKAIVPSGTTVPAPGLQLTQSLPARSPNFHDPGGVASDTFIDYRQRPAEQPASEQAPAGTRRVTDYN